MDNRRFIAIIDIAGIIYVTATRCSWMILCLVKHEMVYLSDFYTYV